MVVYPDEKLAPVYELFAASKINLPGNIALNELTPECRRFIRTAKNYKLLDTDWFKERLYDFVSIGVSQACRGLDPLTRLSLTLKGKLSDDRRIVAESDGLAFLGLVGHELTNESEEADKVEPTCPPALPGQASP